MILVDPVVSIIIINYNTPELTSELISSIKEFTTDIEYEVLVVDNNSHTGRRFSPQFTNSDLKVYHLNRNLGFGSAVNLAATKAQGEFLLFANSDCRLISNIIPEMTSYLRENQDCAACSTQTEFENGKTHSSIRNFPDHKNIRFSRGSVLKSSSTYTICADSSRKRVDAMAATFMMVKRDLFEQVGKFDQRFFMYAEDTDLCQRFREIGKHVTYLGDLKVIHHWGASTQLRKLKMKLEHHRSIAKYFYKHFPDAKIANHFLVFQLVINYFLIAVRMFSGRSE